MEFSRVQSIAELAGGRLITGLALGVFLMIVTTVLIRMCRNSRSKFAIWFLTLLAIAVLPLLACIVRVNAGRFGTAPLISVPGGWAIAMFVVWILGASLGLIRIGIGLWHVRRIRQRCTWLDAEALTRTLTEAGVAGTDLAWTQAVAEFSTGRRVSLCTSEDVSVPTAIGFFRPVVLLPKWAINELSGVELNSILLHELGHLRRWDDWTNLVQKILQALLFFHPAVWWIDSRLALERESACDDFVVTETADARGYAQCLVSVAEKSVGRRAFVVAVAAVSRVRETAARLTRILDPRRPAATQLSRLALAGFAVVTLSMLAALPSVPTFVRFKHGRSSFAIQPQSAPVLARASAEPMPEVLPSSVRVDAAKLSDLSRSMLRKADFRKPSLSTAKRSTRKSRVIEAKSKLISRPSSKLVQTAWVQESSAPTFLLFMQSVTCDQSGTCFISVRTWQVLTVQSTRPAQARNGSGSKAI